MKKIIIYSIFIFFSLIFSQDYIILDVDTTYYKNDLIYEAKLKMLTQRGFGNQVSEILNKIKPGQTFKIKLPRKEEWDIIPNNNYADYIICEDGDTLYVSCYQVETQHMYVKDMEWAEYINIIEAFGCKLIYLDIEEKWGLWRAPK